MSLLISTSKGNRRVSREALDMVPMPEYTSTHRPVAYGDAVDYLKHQIQALDLRIRGEQYGLNKAGDQMFGLISAEPESTGDKSHCLSFGLRQSYNKTLSMGLAVGAQVLVCDNLCFSGDAFKVLRKNTLNVWRDFQAMVAIQMKMAFAHYDSVKADMAILKDTPCNVRRGYSFLGVMVGEGLMTPTQANVAYND